MVCINKMEIYPVQYNDVQKIMKQFNDALSKSEVIVKQYVKQNLVILQV